MQGWFDYLRGDDRSTVNVTLNMIVDNHLKFDTLVADRRIWYVWPNAYRVQMIRRAARRTTRDNPVVLFTEDLRAPRSLLGKIRRRWRERVYDMVASSKVVENGKVERVRLLREDDYKATYGPLISLISEKCSNDNAIDLALGRPMEEYRFVIALPFEKLHNRRARHLRAMVMWEETLRNLPQDCPQVDFEEHKTRYRTLQAIARHNSFSRAARALNLTQPAVSMQVRHLEQALGLPLLERVGKRAFPTRAGEVLLTHADRALRELEAGVERVQELRGVVAGRVRLGTSASSSR